MNSVRKSLEGLKSTDGLDFAVGCGLLLAVARNNEAVVTEVLGEEPRYVTFVDYDSRSALHVAASEGHDGLLRMLIAKGAKTNAVDRWGGTPLDDALRHRNKSSAEILRKHDAKLGCNTVANAGNIINAASTGNVEDVRNFLRDGFSALSKDYDARTPLHLAAAEGHTAIVELLLEKGGDPNAKDRWDNTPLDEAERRKHLDAVALLRKAGGVSKRGSMTEYSAAVPPEDDSVYQGTMLSKDAMIVDWEELQMLDKIGSGAFGVIYKARWRGTPVAAKVLHHIMSSDERLEALHDLKSEAMLLRQLRHPNICMLLGVCLTADHEVMVSELMKCSLADLFKTQDIQEHSMPRATALKYATHFAQGMNYLHLCKPPILHRDLKPANLLLDFSDTLKVADFGLAKLRPLPKNTTKPGELLMTGETGSYRYMAPEVFRHEDYNEKVDVYSFALVFYNMLANMPPFPELNGVQAVMAAALEHSRPLIPRHWDANIFALLQDCWSAEPHLRPSFGQILDRLDELSKAELGRKHAAAVAGCNCVVS